MILIPLKCQKNKNAIIKTKKISELLQQAPLILK